MMIRTFKTSNFIFVLFPLAASLFAASCKSRSTSSGVLSVSVPDVAKSCDFSTTASSGCASSLTDLVVAGKDSTAVEIKAPASEMYRFEISANRSGGFTAPIDVYLVASDKATVLAQGSLGANYAGSSYLRAYNSYRVSAAGSYYLVIDHKGQFDASRGASGPNLAVNIYNLERMAAGQSSGGSITGSYFSRSGLGKNLNQSFDYTTTAGLTNHKWSVIADCSSDKFSYDKSTLCPSAASKIIVRLTDNAGVTMDVPLGAVSQYGEMSTQIAFQPESGKSYKYSFSVLAEFSDAYLEFSFSSYPFKSANGKVELKTLPNIAALTVGLEGSAKGFGKESASIPPINLNVEFDTEAQLSISAMRSPLLPSKSSGVFSSAGMEAKLIDSSGTVLQSLKMNDNRQNPNLGRSVTLIDNFTVGNYKAQISGYDASIASVITVQADFSVSDAVLADGGPSMSSFSDGSVLALPPPNNYLADMPVTSQPYTPASSPIRLPSLTVLNAMEEIRNEFHVRAPKGVERGSNPYVDAGTISACLGNTAAHWSDITIHYYCQIGQARSCYTGYIRDTAGAIGSNAALDMAGKLAALAKLRTDVWAQCSATATTDKEWEWIVKKQSNVFQYVMNAQTYAFDMNDQQAVINKFYRINNPNDLEECKAKRPRRAIDPYDGTHCLPTKVYSQMLQAAGR